MNSSKSSRSYSVFVRLASPGRTPRVRSVDDLFYVENLFREEQKKVKKRKKSAKATTLSFALDDEGDTADSTSGTVTPNNGTNAETQLQRKKFRKNPTVDTSFLPDREREDAERREREELRQEFLKRQEDMKKEEIEITYSYWDGSGHRRSVVVSYPFYFFFSFVTWFVSVRRAMISQPSWRGVDINFLNSGVSTSTISCTSRYVDFYRTRLDCMTSLSIAGGPHYSTCMCCTFYPAFA
jgi:hypothetical protein